MITADNRVHGAGLPGAIGRLDELAHNLWWAWHPEAQELFRIIDPPAWEATAHSPLGVLAAAPPDRLRALALDPAYLARYHRVLAQFDTYMEAPSTWYSRTYPGGGRLIAYFCAEFGLHESIPIYSGGLGVLAGDHCKTASDLGLPFMAVGLWYSQGYFRQSIDASGGQVAGPEALDRSTIPLQYAGPDGSDLQIELELPGRSIALRIWRLQVGRVPVYLLDPDVEANSPADRALCARLYGGDRETRIIQELILGVGGVRAVRRLGLSPTVWHMNEGHAAFMGLERLRELVRAGVPFVDAWPAEANATVFTTHTPVPAGNEVFRRDLVMRYLPGMAAGLGLDTTGFLNLALEEAAPDGTFAMTPLALRLSHRANGVSALHGAVARHMWVKQFPDRTVDTVPITSVTNGVHTGTWVAPALSALFGHYLGPDWQERVDDPAIWEAIGRIPEAELWDVHCALRALLIAQVRDRIAAWDRATGRPARPAPLRPGALTIGFARRFATYKRATLFFHDLQRATRLLTDPARPVQIVFAGKAHPADGGGQALIKTLVSLSDAPELVGKVLFLEGYDIGLARALVQGVDLWLNNPERPQEASGTSGQKAALNGVPNCSIRDGWWDEGFNGANGWAFGGPVGDDDRDSAELYQVLEQSIIPTFFDRDAQGLPRRWLAVMKESIRTLAPAFSAQRMVKEYTERMYF